MRFVATEAGFQDGVGGASNKHGSGAAHYVLFGIQEDTKHPTNSGIYFEWDDETNGSVDCVRAVSVTLQKAEFTLTKRRTIIVDSGVSAGEWARFLAGIKKVFPLKLVGATTSAGQGRRK
jgi:hypothetical protein